jgi:hypothetical protein
MTSPGSIEKIYADIESLKTQNASLKKQQRDLSLLIESSGLQGIQDQITRINDRLNRMYQVISQYKEVCLGLERMIVYDRITFETLSLVSIIDDQFPANNALRNQLLTESSAVRKEVESSSAPSQLSTKFHNQWEKKLSDLGAKLIHF